MSNKDREGLIQDVGLAVRMHQNAVDQVDEAASEYLGLNRTDARCMDIIDQRGRLTAGALAGATGLSTGAITTALDRLGAKGYIRRIRDADDRRKVLVELTERARRRSWKVYGPIAEQGWVQLERYTDEQLAFIRAFLNDGRQFLLDHTARVRTMAAKEAGRRQRR